MRKWKRFTLIALVAMALVFAGAVVAALALEPAAPPVPAAHTIPWHVIASGGQTMSNSSYTMLSTTGQPVTGQSSSASYSLLSGYWQGFQAIVRDLFMPFIVGNP